MCKYFLNIGLILIILFSYSFVYGSEDENLSQEIFRISLKETTQLALTNNFDIQLAKYDAWISRTDEGEAESIYDTILTAEVGYQDDQSKRTSTIAGTKVVDNDYNVGVSKKLPSGTNISVDMFNNRSSTNSIFSTSPLTHDSTLGVTVTQELGKNFFGIRDRGNIKVTRVDIENTEYTSLEKIEFNIAEVQKAYWDLVLQIEQVKIEEDIVAQAKQLYDLHQEKLKDGLVELPEAIASEANYKKRKNSLTLAQNRVKEKVNVLKLLLNITDDHSVIEPTQTFKIFEEKKPLDLSLKNAFAHRRDYKKAHNIIKAKNIALSIKKNNVWPEINLTATLAKNGLGDHFKQAVTQITEEDNPNFSAGLTISFPLGNQEAKSQLKAAELAKAKEVLNLKLLERQITIEIIDQVRNCNVFQELAFSSEEIAELQDKKLQEEEKRFNQGRSDTDTLIRFQEDLVRARGESAEAKHRYYTSLVELQRKSGELLEKYWEGSL